MDTRKYRAEPKSIFEYEPGKSSILEQERPVSIFKLNFMIMISVIFLLKSTENLVAIITLLPSFMLPVGANLESAQAVKCSL